MHLSVAPQGVMLNLNARKMSEAALLEALKQENVKNPLATADGFEAQYKAEFAYFGAS